jgi:high-affinity iron transporter
VLLKGTFNFSPQTTWLQAIVWVAYVATILPLFVRAVVRQKTQSAPVAPAEPVVPVAASPR